VKKPRQERLVDRTELRFKVCLWCGHLQAVEYGICDNCGAGKIGMGKPRELWGYLDLKIESVLKLPEPLLIPTVLKAELEKPRST
jgi:hypothetical protein